MEESEVWRVASYFHSSYSPISSPCGTLFYPYLTENNPSSIYGEYKKLQIEPMIGNIDFFTSISQNTCPVYNKVPCK